MMLEDLYRLLRNSHVQAQGVVDTMTQPIVVLDRNLSVTTANNAFIKIFKVEREDILGQRFFDLGNGQWDTAELRQLIESVIPKASAVIGFEIKHDFPQIGQRTFLIDARRLAHVDDNSADILVLFDDVTERQRHDVEQSFVITETRHRMKNLFGIVKAVAMQTETKDRTSVDYRDTLLGRLEVTLRAQEIAASRDKADLESLLRRLAGGSGAERLHYEGPAVQLDSSKVFAVSMIFHELLTNALKYGALLIPSGEIRVIWSLQAGPKDRIYLNCEWREENGPPIVTPPKRKGYGTELIEGTASHIGGTVTLNYQPDGLTARIDIPL